MNVKIHSIKFDADSRLLELIHKKMGKMDKFFDRIVDGEVFLKLNNEGVENILETNISDNYYSKREEYEQAGIIFCPHKNNTGIIINY
jgi:ribosome-associated translation inhibitor RaiA